MTYAIAVNIDIEQWMKELGKDVDKTDAAVKRTFVTVAERLKEKIEYYTPVGDPALWHWPAHSDYTPGRLKGSWEIMFNDKSIVISNNLPYATRVEFGWSTQAPDGMMRRGIADFPHLLQTTATEYKL